MSTDPARRDEDGAHPRRAPGVPPHPRPAGEKNERADEESEQSFPASDPPAEGGPGI